MSILLHVVKTINAYLSDYILVIMLLGTGIFFTIKTRFVQIRYFGDGIKKVFGKFTLNGVKHKHGLSSFQALTTAIAAQVGTGNIIGACGAILIGGPGAIFWMWIIAFFGMATIYAEAVLAQKTKVIQQDGSITGGPVYYIRKAFPNKFGKFLANFFAIAIILALGFMGCMVQSNSISAVCYTAFFIPPWITGLIIVFFASFIFLGGLKRIASVTEKLVPFMAILYLLGGLIILIIRIQYLPETLYMIVKYAFFPNAIIGGSLGYALKVAMSQGVKRGLFSNEAGMGSTPHAHAIAQVDTPHDQGVVAMIGVFIDTFVVLTTTAFVVISTLYAGNGILSNGHAADIDKTNMAQLAFTSVFGDYLGNIYIAICLFFFAFSTILSWNFFGKINITYLFGNKALKIYSLFALLFIFLGSCLSNEIVWELADLFNQLMVIPNVLALITLSSLVISCIPKKKSQ